MQAYDRASARRKAGGNTIIRGVSAKGKSAGRIGSTIAEFWSGVV